MACFWLGNLNRDLLEQVRELRSQIVTLKEELRRAIGEKVAALDLADANGAGTIRALAERDRKKLELCDALCDRDRAFGMLEDARDHIDQLAGDAGADAARSARLEGELAESERARAMTFGWCLATAARELATRARLISAIRKSEDFRAALRNHDEAA